MCPIHSRSPYVYSAPQFTTQDSVSTGIHKQVHIFLQCCTEDALKVLSSLMLLFEDKSNLALPTARRGCCFVIFDFIIVNQMHHFPVLPDTA